MHCNIEEEKTKISVKRTSIKVPLQYPLTRAWKQKLIKRLMLHITCKYKVYLPVQKGLCQTGC